MGKAVPETGRMKLLWENQNKKKSFPSQTVSLDLTKYKMVLILSTWLADGWQTSNSLVTPVGANSRLTDCIQFVSYRDANVSETGVYFGDGVRYKEYDTGNVTDNGVCVPVQIYGII